jgi:predicted ABC-type transport system involved in lysophospholipase L1 biosynthesis ATPase subunit
VGWRTPESSPNELSGGEQQKVAIAGRWSKPSFFLPTNLPATWIPNQAAKLSTF